MQFWTQQQNPERLLARAWLDPAFRERLKSEPNMVLSDMGVQIPADVTVEVLEQSADRIILVLPAGPVLPAVTDQEIEAAGSPSIMLSQVGDCTRSRCTACSRCRDYC